MPGPNDAENGRQYRPGYEVAAERILEYIGDNELQPGNRLPTEQQLASILGVSRPVTRDAVRTLAAIGRITVRKGAGMFVASGADTFPDLSGLNLFLPTNLDQVYMLFEIRRTLEVEASRIASTRATPQEVGSIQSAVRAALEASTAHDFDAFRQADDAFHSAVASATHNMFFVATIGTITQLRRQVIAIGLSHSESGSLQQASEEHDAVSRAIAAGDADSAARAMQVHVEVTSEQFRRAIQRRLFSTEPSDGADSSAGGTNQ